MTTVFILCILLSACTAFVLIESIEWHVRLKLPRKPFGCEGCLTGWLTPIAVTLYLIHPLCLMPFWMCAAVIIGNHLSKLLLKL